MKQRKIRDERVQNIQNKIGNEALIIVLSGLIISILIHNFYKLDSFVSSTIEAILVVIAVLYMISRSLFLGLDLNEGSKNHSLLISLISGILISVFNGIFNYLKYSDVYDRDGMQLFFAVVIVTFISGTLFTWCIMSVLNHINQQRQLNVQKKMDREEMTDDIQK